jgi:aldehyde dehydrogenase (NAD+)
MAAERAVPCVMELGGKSAAVVFPDANIKQLEDSIKWGIFFNAGQVCSAMSRLIVHEDIKDKVLETAKTLAQALRIGDCLSNADLTPVTSASQQQRVLAMCETALSEGATLQTGGKAPDNHSGYFVEPTIFSEVTPDMSLFRDEVFGPVLAISTFSNEEQAWQLANSSDYGLVAGVFTQDLGRAMRATQALKAGQVFVNQWYAGGIETPFGGTKLSGFGREKGVEALYSYVQTKNVAIRLGEY